MNVFKQSNRLLSQKYTNYAKFTESIGPIVITYAHFILTQAGIITYLPQGYRKVMTTKESGKNYVQPNDNLFIQPYSA